MSVVQPLTSAKFITYAGKNALPYPWIPFSFGNESAVQYLKIDNIPKEILQQFREWIFQIWHKQHGKEEMNQQQAGFTGCVNVSEL